MNKKKTKLIRQIFPVFLVIIILSLSAVASYSTSYFKNFFLENSEKELMVRAKLLQAQFADILVSDPGNMLYIDDQCKDTGNKTGTRVTVILPSGTVIGDSFGETDLMENHLMRPEIMAAFKGKEGISRRYSSTLDKNMMYIALPVIKGETIIAVVRTSLSVSIIDDKIKSVRNSILLAMLATILIAGVVSLLVSRHLTRPIEEMKKDAAEFAKGNLNRRMAVPDSEELSELAVTMNQMAKNLNEKIKAFENRSRELEAVHASMQEGVIALDKDQRIITVNQAAAKIFGFDACELKARYILEAARNVEFQRFIRDALNTCEPMEEDILIPGDEDLILNIHSSALYDTRNLRMGTLIIFHDITRIRRLEKMHKEFAANVSHELKTPLTSIMGFIETLQQMLFENNTEEAAKFLHIIEKNVNRMVALVDDLLSLSRLERLQGTHIHFERHNLASLICSAVNSCESAIKAKNILLNVDCPGEMTIQADPILMEQAIINLLDNAVKYSAKNTAIAVTATKNNSFTDIIVKDNGSGIDKEHLPKIFNRFYRVDRSRSRNQGGTGLGLAIVKHIVQYHRGKIDVESTRDKGTIFKISIPAT
ncbi:MAG: PAS domain-containing sensor histidine kinase [Desulfobacterales bacterium RIFOXYA12_FULL_46_15]|nr:MAG: PAS domain-containing sensor histidine kinase [Desulfobacterales bacterium RIFOXYA12_FULL_46_15]